MNPSPITVPEAAALLAPLGRFPCVALAVSGGPDSLALAYLAARWRAAQTDGPALSVLTVDHGLRSTSRGEAEMVARFASELGLPHTILTWETSGARGTSLQARARAARYDLMAAHCHANTVPSLATAHHLDDQAETFLMRLKRGSGLDGLAAIPEQGSWAGIAVLRPLLDVPKARLVATLDAVGIAFVSDPSNVDPRFERARLRASSVRPGGARAHAGGAGAVGASAASCARGARSGCPRLSRHQQRDQRRGLRAHRRRCARSGAARDCAARAGAADRGRGRQRDGCAARQARGFARRLASRPRQAPHARPLPDRAIRRAARHLPRGEGGGSSDRRSFCPDSACYGTTASGSSSAADGAQADLGQSAGRVRLARPSRSLGACLIAASLGG